MLLPNTINKNEQEPKNNLVILDKSPNYLPYPIIFWGGVDINPSLYGEEPSHFTQRADNKRDVKELGLALYCKENSIPMIGICRGAQLLNVFNGGKLCQHIEGHTQNHTIITNDGELLKVNSTHHQMMLPTPEATILATTKTKTYGLVKHRLDVIDDVYEVVYYPETLSLCIQFHPEDMRTNSPAVLWLQSLVEKYFGYKNFTFKDNDVYYGEI